MANTYTLIASNTLSSSAASVTFSAIPNTFTDLVLRASVRNTVSSAGMNMKIEINGSTSSVYSETRLGGYNSTTFSDTTSNATTSEVGYVNGDTSTADTFSSVEIYIPSYTASQNKPFSSISALEQNATTNWFIVAYADLFRDTSAINSIKLKPNSDNWKSGSSFFLYGIKNS